MPAILALGIITSYEDVKEGKIRNKWIMLALVYAFGVYSILLGYAYFSTGVNMHYFITLLTNLLFVGVIGFGGWYFSIWTAGDGKLFIAFSTLLPLSVYEIGYQNWIPSVTLLINIFIPSLLIMIVFILFKVKIENVKRVSKSLLREIFQPKQLLSSAIQLFAIYWVMGLLIFSIGLGNNYSLNILLTVIVLSSIQKTLKNKALYIMLMVSLLRFVIDKSIYSLSFLVNFLMLILIWIMLRSFFMGSLSKLGQEIFAKEIKINELNPGMVLSEVIQKKEKMTEQELKEFKKIPGIDVIMHKGVYYVKKPKSSMELDNFVGEEAEGLTKKQINKIKMLGIKRIRISQTTPFAPFMFLGALITMVINGNILIVVKNLI